MKINSIQKYAVCQEFHLKYCFQNCKTSNGNKFVTKDDGGKDNVFVSSVVFQWLISKSRKVFQQLKNVFLDILRSRIRLISS